MPTPSTCPSPEERWLSRYIQLSREHAGLIEQYDQTKIRAEAPATAKLDGMPRAPGFSSDALSLSVSLLLELEEEITEVAAQATAVRREISEAIKMIKSGKRAPYKRTVLRGRYIMDMKNADVCSLVFGGEPDFLDKEDSYMRRIFKLRKEALEDMRIILRSGKFPSFAEYDKNNAEEEETGNEQSSDED